MNITISQIIFILIQVCPAIYAVNLLLKKEYGDNINNEEISLNKILIIMAWTLIILIISIRVEYSLRDRLSNICSIHEYHLRSEYDSEREFYLNEDDSEWMRICHQEEFLENDNSYYRNS